jgi:calcineurin-like phosphoesterase family protein
MIDIVYTLENIKNKAHSIFLAGPTHRILSGMPPPPRSWRFSALEILETLGYTGNVYVPEWRDSIKPFGWTYSRQLDWENVCLANASVILFWIPREMNLLPALTTNIEFGEWVKSGKIVVGAPSKAESVRYIREKCSRNDISWSADLGTCVSRALDKLEKLKGRDNDVVFTADTHFGNARTLELSKRPFNNVDEMDWAMVKGWNECVTANRTVCHIGDFGDPSYLKHLKGRKIMFLPGNYDSSDIMHEMLLDNRIVVLQPNAAMEIQGHAIRLIHEPEEGEDPSSFYLFGHIHKLQMVKINGLNVGVDCHHFRPIDANTVLFYKNAILNHYDKNVFTCIGEGG